MFQKNSFRHFARNQQCKFPNFKSLFARKNINRLLYEYGEILTRVSIAVTRACECHANANECQYFSIFVQ